MVNVELVTCGPSPVHSRFTFVLTPVCLCFRCSNEFSALGRCFVSVAVDEAFEEVCGKRLRLFSNLNGDAARIALTTLLRQRQRTNAVANHANQGPALGAGTGSLDQRNNI